MEHNLEKKVDSPEIIFLGDDVILKTEGVHKTVTDELKNIPKDLLSAIKDLSLRIPEERSNSRILKKEPVGVALEPLVSKADSLVPVIPVEKPPKTECEFFKEDFEREKKEVSYKIAQYLVKKYHVKTVGEKIRDIYIYKDGLYVLGLNHLRAEIQEILQELAGTHYKKEIIEIIKDSTPIEREKFNPEKNLINLKNGIYNIDTRELISHDPKHLFFYQMPFSYNKEADCPEAKKFLNQILDEECIKIIQEWFGYCLYRSYFVKKAIILVGERDTGKTTLLRILQIFLGKGNFSGINLEMISSGRFALSNLENKHANIYDDLSFRDISDNGTFKMLTGGGSVSAEKKFGECFQFENYAKLTFSCNKIPNVKDTDDGAYFSRWIVIRFEYKAEKPDKFLINKINTEEEMSGVLNFALDGLYRLLENQDFSYTKTPEEVKREMMMSGSPLAQFTHNKLEVVSDPNIFITKDDMYQGFIDYAKSNNLAVMSKEALGKSLPRYIKVSNGKKSIKNKETGKSQQIYCWLGVRFTIPAKENVINVEKINDDGLSDFPEG